jgi:ankyrin repeat protein
MDFAIKNLFKSTSGDILVDDQGATLLHKAAHYGVYEIVKDISMSDEGLEAVGMKDNNGWTVAMIAERWHHENFPTPLNEAVLGETSSQLTTQRPERLSNILIGRDLSLSNQDTIVTMAGK